LIEGTIKTELGCELNNYSVPMAHFWHTNRFEPFAFRISVLELPNQVTVKSSWH